MYAPHAFCAELWRSAARELVLPNLPVRRRVYRHPINQDSPMRIFLFRHGPAGSRDPARWPDDVQRPLSSSGEGRTDRAARGLARVAGKGTLVFSSPLVRAHQTAKLLRAALELEAPIETLDALAPGGSYREVVQRLAQCKHDDAVFLVGHEPDLGKLAGVLVFGAPASSLPLKKAGVAEVIFDDAVRPGAGRLHLFLSPRVLRRMARRGSKV
jgi:phosphohistidine phosphatase